MSEAVSPSTAVTEDTRRAVLDRLIDIATVILISLAAVGTAWCGYEAARWSALQAYNYSRANAARIEASSAAARSNALRMIDVGLFVQYEAAVFDRRDAFAAFLRRRFRPEFRKAVDVWLATKPETNRRAPLTPFSMPQYRLASDDRFKVLSKRADDLVGSAVRANEVSDGYVFLTVLFAAVTFLGGIAIKARYPWHMVLACVGFALLVVSMTRLVQYPVR